MVQQLGDHVATLTSTTRQQGASTVTTVPGEIVRRLGIRPGEDLAWVEDGFGGFRVTRYSAETQAALEQHESIMNKYDSVFRALAK